MSRKAQAHVDPESLRALASDLAMWSSKVIELGQQLDVGLSRLGETFRDDHYHDFRAMFQASRVKLDQFAADTRAFVPKLRQDADDVAASQAIKPER
jgi:hypothetical protein